MNLNNIDFPNQVLDAIQDDKLVVFAGAGASAEKPTSLPDFVALANQIAEGTGRSLNKESCEVFLGYLKATRCINVNEKAAQILSDTCLKPNDLHRAIIDLFPSIEKIKIVTTNYDLMFERVMEERGEIIQVYSSPALPLGNDIKGIVHIHGDVGNPKYMVLTDEDFGRTYLTEGYVSRFLVKLFEHYTVLFVGYSYKDTILRYLTRAMSREHSSNRFILTDDIKSDWDTLGIRSITFPKKGFKIMRKGLIKLGNYAKKGLLEWNNRFAEIADNPPKDLTIDTEIDYCLRNEEKSRVLSSSIHGDKWLRFLDRKGVFSCCFSGLNSVDAIDSIWANWLCDNFVGKDDNSLFLLFTEHRNDISNYFSKILLEKIILSGEHLGDVSFRKYVTILDQFIIDPLIILRLIEISYDKKIYHLSLHLFKKLFVFSIKMEKRIRISREDFLKPYHLFKGDYYYAKKAWDIINGVILPEYSLEVLSFVQNTIEDIHYQYTEIEQSLENKGPWTMSMLVIEDREKESNKNPFHVLAQAFIQAIQKLDNDEYARFILSISLCSKSFLLRKIALRAIRESDCFSKDEKITLICEKTLIWSMEIKEQVFMLVKETFSGASKETQTSLLNIIEEGSDKYKDEENRQYSIYNWCIWLKRSGAKNERIDSIIKRILNNYSFFKPRNHPELSFEIGDVSYAKDIRLIPISEMLIIPVDELIEILVNSKNKPYKGITKERLLSTFSDCIIENQNWARMVISYLKKKNINDVEIWNHFLFGLEEANLTVDESFYWCKVLIAIVDVIPDVQSIASFLRKILQNEQIRPRFKESGQELVKLSENLWNRRKLTKPSPMRQVDKVYNTTTGLILLCWIYMLSYTDDTGLSDPYKK